MDGLGLHPAPPSRSPLSARAFGPEVLLGELIGRGGMSRVYRGWLRGNGVEVAVKVLRDDLAAHPESVQRFVRERDLLAAVASPHVVRVHDLVVHGDELGIVMDLVPGGHLRRAVTFPCPPLTAAQLTIQIADGLAAVHALGVVHRDLKPENVLVDDDGSDGVLLRLTDFGISRLVDAAALTQTSVTGTPGYLAPEIAAGAKITAAADVYALGVVLYELCTGRGPFLADNPLVLVLAHTRQEPPRPGGMPDRLWALLSAMLAKAPAARPTAAEVSVALRDLLPLLGGLDVCTPPPPLAGEPAVPEPPTVPAGSPALTTGPSVWPAPPVATDPPVWPAPPRPPGPADPSGPAAAMPLSRRAMLRPAEPGPGPRPAGPPSILRRPPVLVALATTALLLVVLAVVGLRAALTGTDVVTPDPTPTVVPEPTGSTAPLPVITPPTSPAGAPRTITQQPTQRPAVPPATNGSTTSAGPSPTPSPDVPTLIRRDTTPEEKHSSDRQARLAVGGVKANAGTITSITIRYDGGSVPVPVQPAGATSYDVTVEGLENGRPYLFTAEVCNSTARCSASASLPFTPYAAPRILAPRLTASGQQVTVSWSSVERNSHPGDTRCQLVVAGAPNDPEALRRSVDPDKAGSDSFTGKPATTYRATMSCKTDEVSDGAESSDPLTLAAPPPPSPSPTTTTTTSSAPPAAVARAE